MEIKQKKKVAVVITGHLRTFKMHFKSFQKNVLDQHDCDLYLSTWDHNIIGTMLGGSLSVHSDEQIAKATSIYPNVKKLIIGKYNKINHECGEYIKKYEKNNNGFGTCPDPAYKKYIGGLTQRQHMPYNAGQWWPVQEGFRAIDNPEQYDVIMRTRFDIHHLKPVRFLDEEIVSVHPGPRNRPGSHLKQTDLYNIKNHIFYGKHGLVEIMSDIFEKQLEVICKFRDLCTDSLLEYLLRNNHKGYPLTIDNDFRETIEYGVWK